MSKVKKKSILESVVIQEIYDAVTRYIELRGGKLVVIGGIEIQQWPEDLAGNFKIAIRCTGREPVMKAQP